MLFLTFSNAYASVTEKMNRLFEMTYDFSMLSSSTSFNVEIDVVCFILLLFFRFNFMVFVECTRNCFYCRPSPLYLVFNDVGARPENLYRNEVAIIDNG